VKTWFQSLLFQIQLLYRYDADPAVNVVRQLRKAGNRKFFKVGAVQVVLF
jgi:hypothetical protein